jgi:hypothetical protein
MMPKMSCPQRVESDATATLLPPAVAVVVDILPVLATVPETICVNDVACS